MLRTPERIVVGTIVTTHGIHGEVRVKPLTDFPERFGSTEELLATHPSGRQLILHPTTAKLHKNVVLLKCLEFDSIDSAKPWVSAQLCIAAADLVELPAGRYYVFQLLGLQVYTKEGLHLGELVDVLSPGANDVYVVRLTPEAAKLAVECDGKELLLPVIDEVVLETDLAAGRLIVQLLEGLL